MSLFNKNAPFDRLIDKATSHLLLEPDWASNLSVCDSVRQGEVTGKYAVSLIRKKMNNTNPHVILYSLHLLESMAKNCGSGIHDEIATQDFMNQMKNLVKEKDPVRSKSLELIQLWAHAFRNQSKYSVVQTTYNNLKSSGATFPPLVESDAMFISETAPEWQDSDSCYRCKIAFSTLRRKHHCRNCGNIFCDDCTTKRTNIPKFGIEKEVRVCDSCYEQIRGSGRPGRSKKGVQFSDDVNVRNFTPDARETENIDSARLKKERELELQEKEELELALALSASEAESNEKKSKGIRPTVQPTPTNQTVMNGIYSTLDTSEMDPELARYLNRNYWDNKAGEQAALVKTTQPSAPVLPNSPVTIKQSGYNDSGISTTKIDVLTKTGETESTTPKRLFDISPEQQEFLTALRSSIEIFVNRMQSNRQRGRNIANDSSVQTLFLTLNAMHPQLLQYINDQDDRRNYFESLQDKLAQLRDAREALDALREEQREKRRREEEEAARLRQLQMMQKLEIMRQKKKEYLDYQRQLAVDRMHQQEREMAARLVQQQQLMQIRQYQQQYPYMVHQQQQNSIVGQDGVAVQPSFPVTAPPYSSLPQPMHMDAYGAGYSHYGIPTGTTTDYYNMQGMIQTMSGPRQVVDGVQTDYPNAAGYPVHHPQHPNQRPNWDPQNPNGGGQHSISSQVLPQATPIDSSIVQSDHQKEDQLISFD